ncbi:nuclear transport factor 2 family protein [Ramlibacter sp. AW1]|uniref:Nuclear transport factor 2 family protein n=1 Tax=Ramlibacter aurantiacus TaxID=2801330 RepID=A0A937D5Q3_9BURK|nr:nuclear transport factor 2 family protein [Ramlibacter aurantiacus]MBL0421552.1 nuclear transport factor 2 family protein [Ramlibacter aurantiacus]
MSTLLSDGVGATQAAALQELLDRAAITRVVQDWGLARDAGRWSQLRACFTADATMHTTWFVGSAAEFVERSIQAALAGVRSQHFIGAATITLRGNKAVVETRMILMLRAMLAGEEVDATCWGRFHDRFVRDAGVWRIKQRVPVYEKDRLDPVNPAATLHLDPDLLARNPVGYRHLAYLQSQVGAAITPGLPTPDSTALVHLEAASAAWLAQEG